MTCVALVAWLLAGCASTRYSVADTEATWRDVQYDEVVKQWGAPARSTTLSDGRVAHTWVSESGTSRSAGGVIWPSIGVFGGSSGGGVGVGVGAGVPIGGGNDYERCERTLIFSSNRVVEQTWNGPAGYCSSFRRS